MKIKILSRLNIILASLIAMLGFGCKAQKAAVNTTQDQTAPEKKERVVRNKEIMCLYGPPASERVRQQKLREERERREKEKEEARAAALKAEEEARMKAEEEAAHRKAEEEKAAEEARKKAELQDEPAVVLYGALPVDFIEEQK
jgi:alpha-galactosidase/6-phospho-beta-glucosidase family protein